MRPRPSNLFDRRPSVFLNGFRMLRPNVESFVTISPNPVLLRNVSVLGKQRAILNYRGNKLRSSGRAQAAVSVGRRSQRGWLRYLGS